MPPGPAGVACKGCPATGSAVGSGELKVVVNLTLGKMGASLEHKLKV